MRTTGEFILRESLARRGMRTRYQQRADWLATAKSAGVTILAAAVGVALLAASIAISTAAEADLRREEALAAASKAERNQVACMNGGGVFDWEDRILHLCDKATRHKIGEAME